MSLNVNGLNSKLNLGVLDIYLKNFDVICLSETKTDNPDLSQSFLHDYECYSMQKSMYVKYKYGGYHGMCIFMKTEIFAFSEKIQGTVSESILWIKVDSNVLGYEFVLAAVYLPCEGSIHYSNEVFDNFVHDVIDIRSRFDLPFCFVGDFNARTGTLNDFLDSKDKILNLTGFDFSDDDHGDTDILKALQNLVSLPIDIIMITT